VQRRLFLACKFGGDDIVNGYWEKTNEDQLDDSLFLQNQHLVQITIYEAHPSDSGEYYCVILSQWGITQSDTVQVDIKGELIFLIALIKSMHLLL